MKKLIITHAENKKLTKYTAPYFKEYAKKFNYKFKISISNYSSINQSKLFEKSYYNIYFNKIFLLKKYLEKYDYVLWVDNDVLPLKYDLDILDSLRKDDFQALSLESRMNGEIIGPNSGLWLIDNSNLSSKFLNDILKIGQIEDAFLHDQATISSLLGFGYKTKNNEFIKTNKKIMNNYPLIKYITKTRFLAEEWNMLPVLNKDAFGKARFIHLGGMDYDSKETMLKYAIISNRLKNWEKFK